MAQLYREKFSVAYSKYRKMTWNNAMNSLIGKNVSFLASKKIKTNKLCNHCLPLFLHLFHNMRTRSCIFMHNHIKGFPANATNSTRASKWRFKAKVSNRSLLNICAYMPYSKWELDFTNIMIEGCVLNPFKQSCKQRHSLKKME